MVRKRNRRIVKNQKKLSFSFNGVTKRKIKKKGWRGESRRHSEASVKGWNSRFKKGKSYSLSDVKKLHAKRSGRARTIDNMQNSKLVGKSRYGQWVKNPNRFDVAGVDSNKHNTGIFVKFINWNLKTRPSNENRENDWAGDKIVGLIDQGKIKTFEDAKKEYFSRIKQKPKKNKKL